MGSTCRIPGCSRQRFKTSRTCHRHLPPSADLTRAVWQRVTACPSISHQRLADQLHASVGTINRALGALIDAGYIEVTPGRVGARRVIVGYGLMKGHHRGN